MAIPVLCAKYLFPITSQTGRFCAGNRDLFGIRPLGFYFTKLLDLLSPLLQTPAAPKGGSPISATFSQSESLCEGPI